MEVLAMRKSVDDQFAHFIRRKFIAVVAICPLEIAAHVDFGKDVVQTDVNEFRHGSCELAPVEKYILVVALEETALEPDGKCGVASKKRVGVRANPSVAPL